MSRGFPLLGSMESDATNRMAGLVAYPLGATDKFRVDHSSDMDVEAIFESKVREAAGEALDGGADLDELAYLMACVRQEIQNAPEKSTDGNVGRIRC